MEPLTLRSRVHRALHYPVPLEYVVVSVLALAFIVLGSWRLATYWGILPVAWLPEGIIQNGTLTWGSQPALSNPDFFAHTREEFIRARRTFVEADLSAMKLTLYRDGAATAEFPILTKGKEGSWWETPAGLYRIETKERNHFSSFGYVYQPWSMAFQGNFFIHGWPYYEDGTDVSSAYSGGCIRLSTADSEALFSQVEVGTPVLVFERDFGSDGTSYERRPTGVSARSFLAADLDSNYVFLGNDPDESLPVASLTKLLTALVAVEYINVERDITITPAMLASSSKPRLKAGQQVSVYSLLFPLLMESSNEAAEAIAIPLGRSRFISLMNQKAQALGMRHTLFTDVSGAGVGNISTAEDLFHLAKYIRNNRSFIFKISAGQIRNSVYGEPVFTNLENFNVLPGGETLVGGKVGETEAAGETGLYVVSLPLGGEPRTVAIVLLGSRDRVADAETIIRYIKDNFSPTATTNSLQ